MKKALYLSLLVVSLPLFLFGQNTVIATGNWDATTTWQSGNIADVVGENVAFTSGEKTITVQTLTTYTAGNVVLAGDGNLTIVGTLNIGSSGNARTLTGNDSRDFSITGNLTIWGDVTLGAGATWVNSGTVEIKGNLTMGDGASITNSGNFNVRGNWNSGQSTAVISSGPMDVDGDVTVGTSSTLTNSANFTARSCTGPAGFCNNVLPIILKTFSVGNSEGSNLLKWVTASEINFQHFVVERSANGEIFSELGIVEGSGTNFIGVEMRYAFSDRNPIIGKNYYRLKSIDLDGYFEYSKILMVVANGSKNVCLYPSPSEGTSIGLQINFVPLEDDVVQVFNSLGTIQQEFRVSQPSEKISFNCNLNPGNYFLRYVSRHHQQVIKFFVEE
jgi:hypothetical protein